MISPRVREFAWDDFLKTPKLVEAGEAAAIEALPRIREVLERGPEPPTPLAQDAREKRA